MASIASDFRFALRSLLKTPGFTIVAIIALGLGIGANTAIFSGVNALLLGPMPYSHPEQLVAIWEDASAIGFPHNNPAVANYFDWRRMNHVFTDLALLRFRAANLTGGDHHPEMILGRGVTANFFHVLGVRPLLGRTFTSEEDRTGAKLVVISYGLWQRRFGGARDALSKTLRMDDESFTVIGIMPPGFPSPDRQFDYWQPIHLTPQQLANRTAHGYDVVARLRPGVSVQQAQADMSRVAAQLEKQHPDTNRSLGAAVVPLRRELVGDTGTAFLILLAAAAVVLLIACANVANLLLTRGTERRRELAVRAALGASRPRLIRQLISESLILSTAGAVLAVLLAGIGIAGLQALIPPELASSATLSINLPILAFAIAVSFASGLLFGVVPAHQSSRLDLNEALKQGARTVARGTNRLRSIFVVSQVALALVLLSGAGLLIQTLSNLRSVNLGFPSDHLLTLLSPLSPQEYNTDAKILSFNERVIDRVTKLPGVRSAGFASDLPFTSIGDTDGFVIEGRPPSPQDQLNDALYREITLDYLETLGTHLLAGRLIDSRDTANSHLALVINETFARRYWPHASPLGARVRVGGTKEPWRTVVGVIADVHESGVQFAMKPAVYLPATQVKSPETQFLLVRTTVDPGALAKQIQRSIWSVDPEVPVTLIRTMDEYIQLELRNRAHQMNVFAIFAGLALFLASLGIYGVLAYSVAQRRREIGVRMALGARATSVTGLVLRQALSLTAAGLIIGAAVAAISMRAIQSMLFEVKPLDPLALSAGGIVLLFSALAACLIPALTAARVDPMIALREE